MAQATAEAQGNGNVLAGFQKAVELELRMPLQIRDLLYLPSREVRRIIVASDRPAHLCAKLEDARP